MVMIGPCNDNTSHTHVYTVVKPVLRDHLETKKKWFSKTGDLKEVQITCNILWRQEKDNLFNAGDCLIEVITWSCCTDY